MSYATGNHSVILFNMLFFSSGACHSATYVHTDNQGILKTLTSVCRAGARVLIGAECIFIYSGSAQLFSFEIKLISKEISRAEPEYMNIPPPPQLAF